MHMQADTIQAPPTTPTGAASQGALADPPPPGPPEDYESWPTAKREKANEQNKPPYLKWRANQQANVVSIQCMQPERIMLHRRSRPRCIARTGE